MPPPEFTSVGGGRPTDSQKVRSAVNPACWSIYPSGLPVSALISALLGPQSMSSQNALRAFTFSLVRFSPVSYLATPKNTLRCCCINVWMHSSASSRVATISCLTSFGPLIPTITNQPEAGCTRSKRSGCCITSLTVAGYTRHIIIDCAEGYYVRL